MKTFMMTACAITVGTSVSASTIDLSETFSSFVAFGDSLTDDGKLFGTPFQPGLPGVGGRFSNGETFAENIATDFDVSINFALGGATARAANETFLPPAFGTFGGQVTSFGGTISDPFIAGAIGDRPLFSVLFGANDILQNIGLPDGPVSPGNVLPGIGALAADEVAANVRAISALDEDYRDFVITNLPDLSETPLFQNPLFGAGALSPLAAFETAQFNAQLAMNIDDLRDEGLNIIEVDLDALFDELIAEAQLMGVDTQTPCSFDLSNPGPFGTCVFSPGSPDNTDVDLADNFFFIDGIHPNRNVHAAFADEFRAAAAPAPVPLPAGLMLMLAGLGTFGYLRFRQTA